MAEAKVVHMSILTNVKSSLMMAVLLLALFTTMQVVPDEAEAAQPTVTIKLDLATKTASVEPGKSGLVIFTGTVEAQAVGIGQNTQYIRVDLETTSEAGWATTISPSSVLFSNQGGTSQFTMSVRVPPATSYRITDNVLIGGRAVTIPGLSYNIPDTRCTVLVEQYYRFSVECSKPYVMTSPASQLVFSLKINNEGNGLDKFQFGIANLEKLSDKGFTVQLSTTSIEIDERESQTIRLQVSTPIKFVIFYKNELDSIQIQVESYGAKNIAGLPLQEDYFGYVRQKGSYIPAFDAMFAVLALAVVAGLIGGMLNGSARRRRK